jgi:hypothetical protein
MTYTIAHSVEIVTDCKYSMASSGQWSIACNYINLPQNKLIKFTTAVHSAEEPSIKVKYLCEFESVFETAFDNESGDLGTSGEITYKKTSDYSLLKMT